MRKRNPIIFTEKSKTQQHLKDDVDINNIVKKYVKHGTISHLTKTAPIYGDFSEVTSLDDAINKINGAADLFAELPAKVRDQFKNDPFEFIKFTETADSEDYKRIGLIEEAAPLPEPPPPTVETTEPDTPTE